jgi:hypothetical protein
LTPASGRQDHTSSPSASNALVESIIRVHRIPPRVRDDREPPLQWDETGRICRDDLPDGLSEICPSGYFVAAEPYRDEDESDLPTGQILNIGANRKHA